LLYTSALAFGTDLTRESLNGIPGVYVRATGQLDPGLESEGLSLDRIEKEMLSRVQKTGIDALSGIDFLRSEGRPFLIAKVNILKFRKSYFCSVNVELYQHVNLIGKPKAKSYPAATWASDGLIAVVASKEEVLNLVAEEVDKFTNDFLAVNPKEY
jgi:hypothetical protein